MAHRPIDLKNWRVAAGLPGLHAARARVARLAVRGPRLRRRVSRREPGAASVHVVVESRPSVGQQHGLAHRLSGREPGARRGRAQRRDLQARGDSRTTRR